MNGTARDGMAKRQEGTGWGRKGYGEVAGLNTRWCTSYGLA